MRKGNLSSQDDFLIIGFSDFPQLQVPLFVIFLLIYLLALSGNLFIIAIIYLNSHLHTPMYFFVTNLSFVDISYTSVIFPKLLTQFFFPEALISHTSCLLQMYFFVAMVCTEILLLGVMAYDRYVAICNPLHYMTIMDRAVCMGLATGSWVGGFLVPVSHTVQMSGLSFCASHIINHLFCDVTALMKLSCSSTRTTEIMSYAIGAVIGIVSFILIIVSYTNIISAILKIQSAEGRHKAFSTCASHLTVVILFFGTVCSTYMRPTSTYSITDNKMISLSYVIVTPLCNPIIYSLKNKEFKNALRNTRTLKSFMQWQRF